MAVQMFDLSYPFIERRAAPTTSEQPQDEEQKAVTAG